jgi:hypothetical protein
LGESIGARQFELASALSVKLKTSITTSSSMNFGSLTRQCSFGFAEPQKAR